MKKRSSSSKELFPSTSKRRSNYLLFDSLKSNRLSLLSRNKNNNNKIKIKPKNSIIQIKNLKKSNSINIYRKLNTHNYKNKKYDSLEGAKIYLKLDKSEEIAKIVCEEDKKRYFNKEFHLNKTLNREELKQRIRNMNSFYRNLNKKKIKKVEKFNSRKERRAATTFNRVKSIKSLININNKLIHNYKYQGENEILKSKKNYEAVNNFLKSMDDKKKTLYEEMEKKFLLDKNRKTIADDFMINNDNIIKNIFTDKEKNEGKINKMNRKNKLDEANFIKFRKKMILKEKKIFKEKSKVFDNILNYDFKNFYTTKEEDDKHQIINYRLLGRTILMRNLMKQMKITVYKDESLNVLRGFQSLKIASIKSENIKNMLQDHYDNQNNNDVFFFSGSIKDRPVPHFLKLKFSMNTAKKFGEINGSYFGLPV